MVLISILIKMFGFKTMVSISSKKKKLKPNPEHGRIMDKITDIFLLEQVEFGGCLWSEQPHDASVCSLVTQITAMASPTCLEITGCGRASHTWLSEGHCHERSYENLWVSCQLPRVPTPCEAINPTNQCPDRIDALVALLMHIQLIFDVLAIPLLSLSLPR